MSGAWPALAPVLLGALLLAAGGAALPLRTLPLERRIVGRALAGLLLLHLQVAVYGALGIPCWSALALAGPLLLIAAAGAWAWRRRARAHADGAAPLDWGDTLALLPLAAVGALAWARWIAAPDFVYHWGLKAHRFALAGGVDYGFLARAWNWSIHPDYPNLFPEALAATTLLTGRWHEPSLLAATVGLIALVLLAARGALRQGGVPAPRRAAVLAAVALACGSAAIGHLLAGAADWLPALALAAALPALLEPVRETAGVAELELGLAAAVAAASKLEGMPLAAGIVGVQAVRLLRARRLRPDGADLRALAVLGLPAALVVLHWGWAVRRHHLFLATNATSPSLARLAAAAPPMLESLAYAPWHQLPFLVLLLPLLFLVRRLRPFVTVAAALAAFDLWAYAATPVDAATLVRTSFLRLVLQLLPAVLTGAAIAWLGDLPRQAPAQAASRPAPPPATAATTAR